VAAHHAEAAEEKLEEAFSAPLEPTAPHGAPRAYATRRAELVKRIDLDFIAAVARNREHREALEQARPFSYMCAPVLGRDRFHGALGFLRVETGTPKPYEEEDLEACAEFAELVGEAIDRSLPQPEIAEVRDAARTRITPPEAALNDPTEKEREVLKLLADGKSMQEMAPDLHISYSTVKTHRRHLCQKLGLGSKSPDVRIVSEARCQGWLPA
ncbi:MAG: LuxR C-terminal-related transcriptional regulator, partial [Gammaproteobacteria bacterium]